MTRDNRGVGVAALLAVALVVLVAAAAYLAMARRPDAPPIRIALRPPVGGDMPTPSRPPSPLPKPLG